MGGFADSVLLLDAVSQIQVFVKVFVDVYILTIFAYILTSWIRLPYSPWLNRVQRFLYDVSEPYLRLFRRVIPPFGPLDISPVVAVLVLVIVQQVVDTGLSRLH
ncbi:MAG: YggT family protein [Thermoleophilia bacterium]|jgi:YggT family protein